DVVIVQVAPGDGPVALVDVTAIHFRGGRQLGDDAVGPAHHLVVIRPHGLGLVAHLAVLPRRDHVGVEVGQEAVDVALVEGVDEIVAEQVDRLHRVGVGHGGPGGRGGGR